MGLRCTRNQAQDLKGGIIMHMDIKDVFCVACILLVVHVNSQTPCPTGWFGPNCKYKCRCTEDSCDEYGLCTGTATCEGGWFGPACQYADLAYWTRSVREAVDGNDDTCINASSDHWLVISLNSSVYFTWMRVRLGKTGFLATLHAKYNTTVTVQDCLNGSYINLDNTTTDIYCNEPMLINAIFIRGEGIQYLCSIYVSGGRNVALRERAEQSSVYSETINNTLISFPADKAVDGRRNQRLYLGKGCSMTGQNSNGSEYWRVVFSQPRFIHRYVVYNRIGVLGSRLNNFTLVSVDAADGIQFTYKDNSLLHQDVYMMVHTPVNISAVTIDAGFSPKMLCLCEVEVYGDSACEEGWYGFDCEYKCGCPCNGTMFLIPGACRDYVTGNISDYDLDCATGAYDPGCYYTCSQYCFKETRNDTICDVVTGRCLQGCLDGYMGATCTTTCVAGQYGHECESACSDNCSPGNTTIGSCHYISGHCFNGCLRGFSGPRCSSIQMEVISAETSSVGFVVGLFVAALFVLFVIFIIRKKRRKHSALEELFQRGQGHFLSRHRKVPRPGLKLPKTKSAKS